MLAGIEVIMDGKASSSTVLPSYLRIIIGHPCTYCPGQPETKMYFAILRCLENCGHLFYECLRNSSAIYFIPCFTFHCSRINTLVYWVLVKKNGLVIFNHLLHSTYLCCNCWLHSTDLHCNELKQDAPGLTLSQQVALSNSYRSQRYVQEVDLWKTLRYEQDGVLHLHHGRK